jgi:hypothetical protein
VFNSIELFTQLYNHILVKKKFYAKGGGNDDADYNLISSESFYLYIFINTIFFILILSRT